MTVMHILQTIFYFASFLFKQIGIGIVAIFRVYRLFEGYIVSFIVRASSLFKPVAIYMLQNIKIALLSLFKKVFLCIYNNPEFLGKLVTLFRMVWVCVRPFSWFILILLSTLWILRAYVLVVLFFPCLIFFSLGWEKIGQYMINHPAVSLGRLKELGLVTPTKAAAFFNTPADMMTEPGISIWREHAILCFTGNLLRILLICARLVSFGVIDQSTMQSVVDFFNQKVFPNYMDYVHANYIGRYLHFVHEPYFIFTDPTFLIPRYREDLDLYFKGDFIYFFLVNLEDEFVQQFISPFCEWIFWVSVIFSLPYGTGFLIYFLLLRIVHLCTSFFLRKFFLPAFSLSNLRKERQEIKVELETLVQEWKSAPSFFGEFYVFISMTCFFLIGFAVLFL